MKSFAMLVSLPESGDVDEARYFIDAGRVSREDYEALVRNSARQDTFQSYVFGNRLHLRSVCYR